MVQLEKIPLQRGIFQGLKKIPNLYRMSFKILHYMDGRLYL